MDKSTIIYQLFPRMFTTEGTLFAASQRLDEIQKTGINVIYLSPVFAADESLEGMSPRQIQSGMNNPKNPYRIKDYFHVDEEYGTDEDLKSFVKKAHAHGIKVLFDLVYMHAGPNAVFLDEHPDFVRRDENGGILCTDYNFPIINHENAELRSYLLSNVEYLVREFDCDGFRCDVGEAVPLDFWHETRKRAEQIKPDLIMLNEGMSNEYLSVFDLDYNWIFTDKIVDTFVKGKSAAELKNTWCSLAEKYAENADKFIRYLDNHDTVNDSYDNRYEKLLGHDGMEAVLFMLYTLDGIPLIYNGNEFCDTSRHSFASNRFHGGLHADRSSEKADERLAFLKRLSSLRTAYRAFSEGTLSWLESDNEKNILSYKRAFENEKFAVIINTRRTVEQITLPLEMKEIAMNKNCAVFQNENSISITAEPFGCVLIKL